MPRGRLEGAQGIEGGEFVEAADHRLAMPPGRELMARPERASGWTVVAFLDRITEY